jgi:hypothetical protein
MSQAWVPVDACTLPTAEQPLRLAEFDTLFAERLVHVDRLEPERAVLVLRDGPGVADTVADLAARESSCCSFFDFGLDRADDRLRLTVSVPPARADVLAALADRAERLGSGVV